MSRAPEDNTAKHAAIPPKIPGKPIITLPREAIFRVPYPTVVRRAVNPLVMRSRLLVPLPAVVYTKRRPPIQPPTYSYSNYSSSSNVATYLYAPDDRENSQHADNVDDFVYINYEGRDPDVLDYLLGLNEVFVKSDYKNIIQCPLCHKYGARKRIDRHYILEHAQLGVVDSRQYDNLFNLQADIFKF